MIEPFANLPRGHFKAIYADPPWGFQTWSGPEKKIASRGTIRQHSRKPDCVPARIERLVEGPYLELFARTQRPGWAVWGNQTDKFEAAA